MVTIDELMALGQSTVASTFATGAARAYLELGEVSEAERWANFAIVESTEDDFASRGPGSALLARVHSQRGKHGEAERLARQAVAIVDRTNYLEMVAETHADLGEVLLGAGKHEEAVTEFQAARDAYRRKGHLVGEQRIERRLSEIGHE
jgi:tetratricopeptide (TPR) repeat protein